MNAAGVSVVICCYNSQDRLSETLRHLALQQLPEGCCLQLVLVDNCCTDATVQLTRKWQQDYGRQISLSVISEPQPGLTHARIAGIRAAEYETIVLCDDDNWLAADYCRRAWQILSDHADVALAGGCSTAVPEVTPPEWFAEISGAWAVGESDYIGYLLGPDAFLRGAGLVVRRSAFLQLLDSGFRFLASDRRGSSLNSGGDAEISKEIGRMGQRLYFDCRLRLQHWIPAGRLTRQYALRLWQGFGAGTIAGDAERVFSQPQAGIKSVIRRSWYYQLLRGCLNLLPVLHLHPLWHRRDPRPALAWCSRLGRLKAIWEIGPGYQEQIEQRVKWLAGSRTKNC